MNQRSKRGYGSDSPWNRDPINIIEGRGDITMRNTRRPLVAMDGTKTRNMKPGKDYAMKGTVMEVPPEILSELEPALLETHLGTLSPRDQGIFIEMYKPLPENMKQAALSQIANMHPDVVMQAAQAYQDQGPQAEQTMFQAGGAIPSFLDYPVSNGQSRNAARRDEALYGVDGKPFYQYASPPRRTLSTYGPNTDAVTVGKEDFINNGNVSAGIHPRGIEESGKAVLSRRGKGDETRQLQEVLKAKGLYKGEIDGIYGRKTEAAVKAFQKSYNERLDSDSTYYQSQAASARGNKFDNRKIAVDGIVGDETRAALMDNPVYPQEIPNSPMGTPVNKYQVSDNRVMGAPVSMDYMGGLGLLQLGMLAPTLGALIPAASEMGAVGGMTAGRAVGTRMVNSVPKPPINAPLNPTIPQGLPSLGGRSFAPRTPSAFGSRIGYKNGGVPSIKKMKQDGGYTQIQAPMEGFSFDSITSNRPTKKNSIDVGKFPQGVTSSAPRPSNSRKGPTTSITMRDIGTDELLGNYEAKLSYGVIDPMIVSELAARGVPVNTPTLPDRPQISGTTESIGLVTGRTTPSPYMPTVSAYYTEQASPTNKDYRKVPSMADSFGLPPESTFTGDSRVRNLPDARAQAVPFQVNRQESDKFQHISTDPSGKFSTYYDPTMNRNLRRLPTGEYQIVK